jgi:hypothetical protein
MLKHHTHCIPEGKLLNQMHELYQSRKVISTSCIWALGVSIVLLTTIFFHCIMKRFQQCGLFMFFILLYEEKWMIDEVIRNF